MGCDRSGPDGAPTTLADAGSVAVPEGARSADAPEGARVLAARVAARPVTLVLVRHGQSTWNVAGRLQGSTHHPPLTDRGRRQAAAAARRIADAGADVVLSSDLVRALETAAVIADAVGVPVRPAPALREQHLGDLEGRLTGELEAQPTPPGTHVSEIRWGGGESVADVHARVGRFLSSLLAEPPGRRAVLVSHGDTLRVALAWLAGRGHRDVRWDVVPNGSVTVVEVPARAGAGTGGPLSR